MFQFSILLIKGSILVAAEEYAQNCFTLLDSFGSNPYFVSLVGMRKGLVLLIMITAGAMVSKKEKKLSSILDANTLLSPKRVENSWPSFFFNSMSDLFDIKVILASGWFPIENFHFLF